MVLFHQMMLLSLFMLLLQLIMVLLRTLWVMLSIMVLRLMGHQNQYGHDDSTGNGMKSTKVNCCENMKSSISIIWWNSTIHHTNMNRT